MTRPIYFDSNATTPVEQEVLDRMIPYFCSEFGNPSNTSHVYGWTADEAVTVAREQVASLLSADPAGIIFTSGATEAVNTVIKGLARGRRGGHIITVETEHKAVLEACECLEDDGVETTCLEVDENGLITADQVADALRPETFLVTVMWANNESGVLMPIKEIAEVVASHSAFFFTDATQAIGKVPVSVDGVDILACSAHKFYGPKGVGAIYIRGGRPSIRIPQLLHGGAQESGRRASTLNVPGIVGMGAAAQMAERLQASDRESMLTRRDRFETALAAAFPSVRFNGANAERLPQTSNATFVGIRAAEMMSEIGRLAVSMGSACTSGSGKPSHVLSAMGLTEEEAQGTVRFSMGRHTSDAQVDEAIMLLVEYAESHQLTPA
mgnify:CR=1 FL=1